MILTDLQSHCFAQRDFATLTPGGLDLSRNTLNQEHWCQQNFDVSLNSREVPDIFKKFFSRQSRNLKQGV